MSIVTTPKPSSVSVPSETIIVVTPTTSGEPSTSLILKPLGLAEGKADPSGLTPSRGALHESNAYPTSMLIVKSIPAKEFEVVSSRGVVEALPTVYR